MNRIQTGGYRYTKKSKTNINSKKDKMVGKVGGYKSGSYLSAYNKFYKRSSRRRSTARKGHK
jgi:hypothetical protein